MAYMKIINFCGAAGAGKSTAAYGLAYEMKKRYVEVELVDEYAKRLVYANAKHMMADQLKILAEQNSRHYYASQPYNGIDYVVTDSPLFLSAFYAPPTYPVSFKNYVIDTFNGYDNFNVFLERTHPYNPKGRVQTEAESDADDLRMKQFLTDHGIDYLVMPASDDLPLKILDLLGISRVLPDWGNPDCPIVQRINNKK